MRPPRVDEERAYPERAGGLGDQRETLRPVDAVAGEKPDAGGGAPYHHAKAVELDLVDPVGAGRWAISG